MLIIVAGGLLFLGGAISLLLGFDIVMTERGSAMTLGGVIAISGGVISVGIGLCLHRLSQLVASLVAKRARPPVVPDRPVVPIVNDDLARAEGDRPASLAPPTLAAGTGMAAAAGIAGGVALSDISWRKVPDSEREPAEMTADPVSDLLPPYETVESKPVEMPDLEAELSRALAEDPESASPEPASDKASFSKSLTGLLGKPSARRRRTTITEPADTLEQAVPMLPDDADSASDERHDTASPLKERAEEIAEKEGPAQNIGVHPSYTDDPDDKTQAAGETAADLSLFDSLSAKVPSRIAPDERSDPVPGPLGTHSDDEQDSALTMNAPASVAQEKIIGSYKVGGRSYTMFGDGSVEAMTEDGVQRFSSMDELRRHLANT